MKNLWIFLGLFTALFLSQCTPKTGGAVAASAKDNKLSKAEKLAGWQLLFDGKTLNGWRNYKSQSIGDGWMVENGTLALNPKKKGGDIITVKAYENYEFRLEWKISECGNSGIMYNVAEGPEYGAVWHTGPEMQILDNSCHPDAKIFTHRAGDLYDMIACSEETVLPAGQWNKVRILVNQGKVEHWLNDKKVVEFEMFTEKWKEMIAKSKFNTKADFGQYKSGHIALQDHSDKVWFKNVKIREL